MLRCLPFGFALFVCLAAAPLAQAEAPTVTAFAGAAPRIDAIRQRMEAFIADGQIAGAVTLATRDGRVIHFDAVGQADLAADRPMAADTMFSIASMTKPIAGAALMILVDEGKVSLDDPVEKYLPEFKAPRVGDQPATRPLLVRHFPTHTAGVGGSQEVRGSIADTVKQLAERPLGFEPGAKWQYGPGLTVCGRIVEVVSGQPFEKFVAERIFAPCGMSDTTFNPTAAQRARLAQLYQPGQGDTKLAPATSWINQLSDDRAPNPSAGLFSTAGDLARFYQLVINGGELDGRRVLSAEAVQAMVRLSTDELTTGFTPGNGWGIGWCIIREPQGATAMLSPGSYGHGGAFGTQGWIDPERKMAFVLLIQRTGFGNSDASDIRRVFQELAIEHTR